MNLMHYAATAYVINNDLTHILFVFHNKLNCWLPPGGHVEANELPSDAALRELKEETGFAGKIIEPGDSTTIVSQEVDNQWIEIQRPYKMMLEKIPKYQSEPEHHHLDFVYVVKVQDKIASIEKGMIKWFKLDSIDDLPTYQNVKVVIKSLLKCLTNGDSSQAAAP